MPSESGHPYGQSPEQGLDRTKPIVLERKRWIRLSHLHRLVLESPLLNRDNRALQVTYNPMGSPEIQSDIVEIHRRENFTKLANRDPLNWHAII